MNRGEAGAARKRDGKRLKNTPLERYAWIVLGAWTLVVAASLAWNLLQTKYEVRSIAHHVAATIYERDILYRRWAAMHGGLYVPVTPQTQPTPYLSHIPERDLYTPSGRPLTLLNPAYMTRQVYVFARESGQIPGHITSLKPIRPENAPDPWEEKALQAFERGAYEVSEITEMQGEPYMRLMRPFRVEFSCLGCHAEQGYQVGDIRGGISVAVPMAPIMAEHSRSPLVLGHLGLWFLGILGIIVGAGQLSRSTAARIKAQETAAAATMAVQTVEGMMDSVVITDLAGRITHANKALADTFGWQKEILGELPTRLAVEDETLRIWSGVQECLTKGYKKDVESVFLTKNKMEVPVLINLSLLKNPENEPVGTIAVITDISKLRQAEEEIRSLNEDLELRVKERTVQLEEANRELEAFSYSVSHDLRSPLRAIHGYSRMLLEDFSERLDAEGQRLLNVIAANTRQMGQLIDDLLAFSRLGRQVLKLSQVNMAELVSRVMAELQETTASRHLEWRLQPLPPAWADPGLLHQVWVNLLANAIKFSSHNEAALIEVGCLQEEGRQIYYVKDNGVGFDMQYADKLFGVFQRLHNTREFEGTGVGLALVQRIVDRHGGRIWAEGMVNAGATFYFTLPRQEE